MKILFLGSGTSSGVPMVACNCKVCQSTDTHDKRFRSSIYVDVGGLKILVDTSPDFRQQALRHGIERIDHLFITHAHVDHLFGLDDIRRINTIQKSVIPLHAAPETLGDIKRIFDYIFKPAIPGTYRPQLSLEGFSDTVTLPDTSGNPLKVTAVDIIHGTIKTNGYIFDHDGSRFAYIPDCHEIPETSMAKLTNLDLLILDTLKRASHPTHLSLDAALKLIDEISPKRALLTHLGHDMMHTELVHELALRGYTNVAPAFDGLEINLTGGDQM